VRKEGNCTVTVSAQWAARSMGSPLPTQVVPYDEASRGNSFRKIAGIFYLIFYYYLIAPYPHERIGPFYIIYFLGEAKEARQVPRLASKRETVQPDCGRPPPTESGRR
jgi:hypothetical protein